MTATVRELYQLLSSKLLVELEERLGKFNPLQVLGIENAEIRHSNVLAWLLSPGEAHGLGDAVSRRIAAHVLVSNEGTPENFELSDTFFADFSDAEVLREWQHIDLLFVSRQTQTVILIENKIWSGESPDQLSRYYERVASTFPGFQILPVFLTLEGHEAENDDRYLRLSHRDVVEIIDHELQSRGSTVSPDVATFIGQYLEAVRRLLGMDQKIEELCRRILKEHDTAMRTLIEVASSRRYALESAATTFAEEHEELVQTWGNSKQAWYMLGEWLPFKGWAGGWNDGCPVALWFSEYYEKLKVVLEVGPIEPPETRLRLIEHLEGQGFRVQTRAKRLESRYTRVFTAHVEILDWEDEEELVSKLNRLYLQDAKASLDLMSASLRSFPW